MFLKRSRFLQLPLVAVVLILGAGTAGFGATQLSAQDMEQLSGGCNGTCGKQSSSCGTSCVPGVCDLISFCSSFSYNYSCSAGSPTSNCTPRLITNGCGEKREDGACGGLPIGRCGGGVMIDLCPRQDYSGNGC